VSGDRLLGVVVERDGDKIKPASLETISAVRKLSDQVSGKVIVFCLTPNTEEGADLFIEYGAEEVRFLTHPDLKNYTHENYAVALQRELETIPLDYLFLPATHNGKELSAVLSALLGVGVATDCISLSVVGGDEVQAVRPISSGKALSTVQFKGKKPYILTLRPNVFRDIVTPSLRAGQVFRQTIELPEISRQAQDLVKEVGSHMDIGEARIVVSGGLGMQGPENFYLLEELADTLGGAVAASRPVVDNGWRDYSSQVGQTGRTVSPDLYIACGISGAVQHLAGMSSSRCIVAINSDAQAPIFSFADYGIVGDVLKLLPIITCEFKKILAS
jgi:electron transfer flavoprotein alpha subunit